MVIFDHITKTVLAVAHAHIGPDLPASYAAACGNVDRLVERLHQGVADIQMTDIDASGLPDLPYASNFTQAGYEAAVEKCKEYIRAGDVFQCVPQPAIARPRRGRAPSTSTGRCASSTRRPFLFHLKAGPACLVGSSPEIMCRVEGSEVTIRPLAGTRRRGATPEDDDRLAAELSADPKERAEHIMLVDLGRNDVGRIRPLRQRGAVGSPLRGALQPCDAPVQHGDRNAAAGQVGLRRPALLPAGRHAVGRAQGASNGDHRRAGAGASRAPTAER